MQILYTAALFVLTALAEITGCYLPMLLRSGECEPEEWPRLSRTNLPSGQCSWCSRRPEKL